MNVYTTMTECAVSALPEEKPDTYPYEDYAEVRHCLTLLVQRRRGNRWVVLNHFGYALDRYGEFSRERRFEMDEAGSVGRVYGNADGWEDTHYFPPKVAMALAEKWAPKLKVNGKTAADIVGAP